MTPSKETLLPCPFCGGRADYRETHHNHWHVACMSCGIQHPVVIAGEIDPKPALDAAWNTRLAHTAPANVELRWEGDWLKLGAETIGCAGRVGDAWRWRSRITGGSGWSPTEAEARTAAEQAVRDWLARAGLGRP